MILHMQEMELVGLAFMVFHLSSLEWEIVGLVQVRIDDPFF